MMAGKLTKEEIARQFELPERKSKIATLLKQDRQAYCVCRSSDSSRFMIGCDSCEEWYHGDCIGITEKAAKNIKQYYCERCQEDDPSLITKFKSGKTQETETKFEPVSRGRAKREPPPPKKTRAPTVRGCGECTNCKRTTDCGNCPNCRESKRLASSKRLKDKCVFRLCIKKCGGKSKASEDKGNDSSSDGEHASYRYTGSAVKPGMQCYGPSCVQTARSNSKYCSHECGVKLASNRIFQVLPQRIQEWSLSPCVAEEINKKHLDSVRKGQEEARAVLQELDKKQLDLENMITLAKSADIDPHAEEEIDEEGEASIYCITCGHEIHSRSAIKHMEKCFNKYESQASFGSIYKTRIDGNNMFCDFFNPASKTYCKRLRVLCPEHYKDPKISNTEVCGCPLTKDVFQPADEFCRASKKNCLRHYGWEKLRRAEIDMERVRQWLKIDELLELERIVRQRMSSRAGVLALLLHSTYDHEAMERMSSAQEQERIAKMEKTLRENYKEQFTNSRSSSRKRSAHSSVSLDDCD